jgi:hypothetical protein
VKFGNETYELNLTNYDYKYLECGVIFSAVRVVKGKWMSSSSKNFLSNSFILFSLLRLRVSSRLYPSGFRTACLDTFLIPPLRAIYPTSVILFIYGCE